MVPKGLKFWFVVHFVLDVSFAIPLLLFPRETLQFFGWTQIDPLATRLVGAALMGIGVESFLGRNATVEAAYTMQDGYPFTMSMKIAAVKATIEYYYHFMK